MLLFTYAEIELLSVDEYPKFDDYNRTEIPFLLSYSYHKSTNPECDFLMIRPVETVFLWHCS